VDKTPESVASVAVKAVIARDRGACAQCGTNMALELRAARHIDHIVALANAGTNDLCNLQLLCDACNGKKAAQEVAVRSSAPEYLQMAARRRQRQAQSS
jgi:5-methylcytosine-specific restriction endonuclease McrA